MMAWNLVWDGIENIYLWLEILNRFVQQFVVKY